MIQERKPAFNSGAVVRWPCKPPVGEAAGFDGTASRGRTPAKSGRFAGPLDADLARLVSAWPTLSATAKRITPDTLAIDARG